MTVVIDHSVAKHPVKPSNGAFLIAHFGATLQALHKCRLQDIFRSGPGFDASLKECQELPVMVDQALDRLWSERS